MTIHTGLMLDRPARVGFSLSENDRHRLEKLAPHFNLGFEAWSNITWALYPDACERTGGIVLNENVAHRRLLSELCSRAARWLPFRLGESCRDTLLGLTDARLRRIAQLYTNACVRTDTCSALAGEQGPHHSH